MNEPAIDEDKELMSKLSYASVISHLWYFYTGTRS